MKKIRIYTAGAIQFATRTPWRTLLTQLCEEMGTCETLDPVADNAHIFHPSIMGYHDDGTPKSLDYLIDHEEEKAAMLLKQTEENDRHMIKNLADVVFFYYDDRAGHGTKTEFDWAYEMCKEVILVRVVSRKSMAHWNLWRRTIMKSEHRLHEFGNLEDAFNYIREMYGPNKKVS